MGNPRESMSLAVFAAVLGLAAPVAARASIQVEPPTGRAEPAVMDELRAAIETVVAESAPEIDGVFRISAEPSGADVAIVVELATSDGKEVIRESRVASRASAAAQTRAMAREAIRELERPATPVMPVQAAEKAPATSPNDTVPDDTADFVPIEEYVPPKRVFPPLNSPYYKSKALWLSWSSTVGGILFGGAIASVAVMIPNEGGWGEHAEEIIAFSVIGASTAALSVLIGPTLGHFYAKNWLYGWLSFSGKIVFSGLAALSFAMAGLSGFGCAFMGIGPDDDEDDGSDQAECEESAHRSAAGFNALGAAASAVVLGLLIADLATIPRAVQRANEKALVEKERKAKISSVSLAPLLAPGPNGSMTTGLAFSMRF